MKNILCSRLFQPKTLSHTNFNSKMHSFQNLSLLIVEPSKMTAENGDVINLEQSDVTFTLTINCVTDEGDIVTGKLCYINSFVLLLPYYSTTPRENYQPNHLRMR